MAPFLSRHNAGMGAFIRIANFNAGRRCMQRLKQSISKTIQPAIALSILFAAFAVCFASAQTGVVMIAIDKMEIGSHPEGFESWRTGQGAPAQWLVVADETAAGGRAIEQVSADRTDYRFPLAIYKPLAAQNVDVVLRFKAVAGSVDRAGGIAVRLATPDDYYVVRANALEDNVRFYRVVKGRREQLAGANLKVSANEWHTLGLRAEGNKFIVTFNGRQLYTANDPTFPSAGRIALWTKSDSVTRFDNIRIATLP